METALSCMLEMALVSRLVSANCMGVAAAAAGAKAAAGAEAVADGEEDEDQRSVIYTDILQCYEYKQCTYRVFRKKCVFPQFTQGSQRYTSVQSLLMAGNFLYNQ